MNEAQQVRLIGAEFEVQGYKVQYEATIADLRHSDFRFDLIASKLSERGDQYEFVIVELINLNNRKDKYVEQRMQQIVDLLKGRVGYRLEFRFLETTEDEHRRRIIDEPAEAILDDLGKFSLRRSRKDPIGCTEAAVSDWWRWNRILRSIAKDFGINPTDELSTIAESLIWDGPLKEHPLVEYSDIHEALLRTLNGSVVDTKTAQALRWHVRSAMRAYRLGKLLNNSNS